MKKRINPVFAKETKLRVRSAKCALLLLCFNLLLAGITLLGYELVFYRTWNQYVDYAGATTIYLLLLCLETAMVVFMVPAFTAGSIVGEREKQTLDILLTTTMSPRRIVIGKLFSSISMCLLLVVSSLPVISIVFTVGGVGLLDLLQFLLVILITALFIGSICILASVCFQKTMHATVFSFFLVGILCGVTTGITVGAYFFQDLYYGNMMNGVGHAPDVGVAAIPLLFNPIMTMLSMMGNQFGNATYVPDLLRDMGGLPEQMVVHWFWISLVLQMICVVVCIETAACLLNPLRKNGKK